MAFFSLNAVISILIGCVAEEPGVDIRFCQEAHAKEEQGDGFHEPYLAGKIRQKQNEEGCDHSDGTDLIDGVADLFLWGHISRTLGEQEERIIRKQAEEDNCGDVMNDAAYILGDHKGADLDILIRNGAGEDADQKARNARAGQDHIVDQLVSLVRDQKKSGRAQDDHERRTGVGVQFSA